MRVNNYKLILLSILFSLVANINFLSSYVFYPESRDLLLSDLDESYYLRKPYDTNAYNVDNLLSNPNILNFLSIPSFAFIDLAIAQTGLTFNLTPTELGLLFDLLCCSIAFIGFHKFFGLFLKNNNLTSVATILFLLCPWILTGIWELFPYQISTLSSATSFTLALPPIFRAFYTQTSIALMGFILFYFSKFYLSTNKNICYLKLTAFLSGLLIHFYFFAWGSMLVTLPITIILINLQGRKYQVDYTRNLISQLLYFSFFALLGSSLGLIQIANVNVQGLTQLPQYPKYWNVQIETIILLIAFSILNFKNDLTLRTKFLISFAQSLLLAEIILINSQSILNQVMESYHFTIIYLRPLVSSVIILLIFKEIIKRTRPYALNSLVAKFIPVFSMALISLKFISIPNYYGTDLETLSQLMKAIKEKTLETDTISMLALDHPFEEKIDDMRLFSILPNLMHTFTNRKMLYQNLVRNGQAEEINELFRRELLTGWLFSGKVQPVWPCLYEKPELPGDIFYGTETAFRMNRHKACNTYQHLRRTIESCSLLKEFKVDFIVQQSINFDKQISENAYLEEVWHNTEYRLLSFNQKKAIDTECF